MARGCISKIIAAFIVFISLSVGGTYALWLYGYSATPSLSDKYVGVGEFYYAPEEVLPDTPEDDKNQVNHMDIIWELLFNRKMGLNCKDALGNAVDKARLLEYLETIQGGNLKHLIDSTDGGRNLGFVLVYEDDDSFYAYTFYRLNLKSGSRVEVYKTFFETNSDSSIDVNKDGNMDEWIASKSILGNAVAQSYSGSQYTIEPNTWVAGSLTSTAQSMV